MPLGGRGRLGTAVAFLCLAKTLGFSVLLATFVSVKKVEAVHFLVLFCSHNFHLKGCEMTPGPGHLCFRGSLRVLRSLSSTLPCPGAGQRPLWWAGGLSVSAVWGTSNPYYFPGPSSNTAVFPRLRVSSDSAWKAAPCSLNLSVTSGLYRMWA